jgi:hypothetical protein
MDTPENDKLLRSALSGNSKIYGGEAVENSKICVGEAVENSKIYGGEAVENSKIYGGEAVENSKICVGEAVENSKICVGEAVENSKIYGGEAVENSSYSDGFASGVLHKSSTKHICITENPTIVNRKKNTPPPKKRQITTSAKWDFPIANLTLEYQLSLLADCFKLRITTFSGVSKICGGEAVVNSYEVRSLSPKGDIFVRYFVSPENCGFATSDGLRNSLKFPRTPSASASATQAEYFTNSLKESANPRVRILEQLIHSKWYGYRFQDMEKNLFCVEKNISEREIVDTLIDSRLTCFYCRKPVQLFYEFVRESSQWTLDRIDNAYGHNRDNVVIACLGCNLRRKTMYHERFVMTKQMTITKIQK